MGVFSWEDFEPQFHTLWLYTAWSGCNTEQIRETSWATTEDQTPAETGPLKACWVGGELEEAENCGSGRLKRVDRSGWWGWGDSVLMGLSYCIDNYCVRGNLLTTEWSWTPPDCRDPSDSWMDTWMPIFFRVLPIAETNPGVLSHTKNWEVRWIHHSLPLSKPTGQIPVCPRWGCCVENASKSQPSYLPPGPYNHMSSSL